MNEKTKSEAISYPSFKTSLAPKTKPKLLLLYKKYLIDVSGVVSTTQYLAVVHCFLHFLNAQNIPIENISIREINNFMIEQGRYYKKGSIVSIAKYLRSFFRYLTFSGVLKEDLSMHVKRPKIVKGYKDPRFLKSYQITEVIKSIDFNIHGVKRDNAIIILLALYGLRACEIAGIKIDDIKWHAKRIMIRRRRCRDIIELPLLPQVAETLSNYLVVRPQSPHRELFLAKYTPYRPIKNQAVSQIARDALHRAGIEIKHYGSHTFRYSHAQTLFEAKEPLSNIAVALGHRNISTTLAYLQITAYPLQEVALNDGEDLA